jgi:hypothetical protein
MSPTSYQAAPPRTNFSYLPVKGRRNCLMGSGSSSPFVKLKG